MTPGSFAPVCSKQQDEKPSSQRPQSIETRSHTALTAKRAHADQANHDESVGDLLCDLSLPGTSCQWRMAPDELVRIIPIVHSADPVGRGPPEFDSSAR